LAPFLALLLRLAPLPPNPTTAGAELGKGEIEDSFGFTDDCDWPAPIFTKLK
jgi:hypothetical protein